MAGKEQVGDDGGDYKFLLALAFIVPLLAEPHVPISFCPQPSTGLAPGQQPCPPSQPSFSWRVSTGPGRFMALVPSASVTQGQPKPPGTKSAP